MFIGIGVNILASRGAAVAAPEALTAPTISGYPVSTRTLTGTDGTYSGDGVTVGSYQWQRSADGSTGWADISSATNANYTLQAADIGNYVRRGEVASNAGGSAARAYSVASAVIETPITSSLTASTGASLIASGVTDSAGGSTADRYGDNSDTTSGAVLVLAIGVVFHNGTSVVRYKIKNAGSSSAWTRTSISAITVTSSATFKSTDLVNQVFGGSTGANVTSSTVTSLGSGWSLVTLHIDTAGADVTGNWNFAITTNNAGANPTRDGTWRFDIHDFQISH